MSHNHDSMGSMGSTAELPALTEFPKFYYAVVGCAVAVATLVNIHTYVLYRQRLSTARAGAQTPAKPKSWFSLWNATLFALTREASNFSVRIPLKTRMLRLPTVGRTSLIVANAIVLVVLCLYGLDLNNQFTREDVGYRCGVVTVGQLPLIFLLASKNNLIGYLSGVSYERLNWLHRWCARCMLLTATMHMGWFFSAWAPYNYIGVQLRENELAWRGLAAWCVLVWIVFSSMTPIRSWCYELFVLQHIASFALFLYFVYIHTPAELHIYVWIAIGVVSYDRVLRALRFVYANISLFHRVQKKEGRMQGVWACEAEFIPLPHDTTRIVIRDPSIGWTPGQHVFLSCQSIAPLQNHPFTIASIPQDGVMEFFVKAQRGGTRRFFSYAQKAHSSLEAASRTKPVTIEGPYGTLRLLRQFDSVIFLAGSTGATFTVPLLRDILQGWQQNLNPSKHTSFLHPHIGAVTRHVRFVWVVKSRRQLGMFSEKLSTVCADFQALQDTLRYIKLELTVYVTCDEAFTEEHKSLLSGVTVLKPMEKTSEHGVVELRNRSSSSSSLSEGETEKKAHETHILQELTPPRNTCGQNNTCCCRTPIDEITPAETTAPCCCHKETRSPSPSTKTTSLSSQQKTFLHPSIQVYSGRPKTRDIIRRSLEQALGESAVVVCGPQGLVADVKHDVCLLSDERAVHKGTGAQGVYLHTESFGW
ncbi:hypothetical protein P153DRAFT_395450 [Dothidotthia symphoricarpi CBS 119687]|uniref:ferric-chelate reductase (NADPH) n=1 Tax=Dothidotthia symphoricarpi CBS 119687 TaxID=1392245 RepID=A0A6A6AGL0_9PLEO|nr:uncharacterized protein P153DRAFT_395450 [Dothidotthia symphoricarpi CBS 119687]KAF2131059.1 hypothetical protein P153DRAFT_395450 [Dothidotthia symphoricarpi CBS 119687]